MSVTSLTGKTVSSAQKSLQLFDKGGNGEVASNSSVGFGMEFSGRNNKKQNDIVFNNLDSKAKEVIASTIGNKAWVNPEKIAKALKSAGIQATAGKTKDAAYLEITNSDGSKSRIWDIGGDSGIGTQDIDFNSNLSGSLNDIKSNLSSSSCSSKSSAGSSTSNSTSASSDVANAVSDVQATLNNKKLQNISQTFLLEQIKNMLKDQGYSEDDAALQTEAERLLPYYNSILL